MITCNQNNFGAPAISFEDYQDPALCILNGRFTVDPTCSEYQAAERLEIVLPSDFALAKSAVSAVTLISGKQPIPAGTVLRCWIENSRLCIEKLTHWDEFGTYQIIVSSGFVARGYRGEFQKLHKLRFNDTTDYRISNQGCVYTDDFLYLVMSFRQFPSSNDSKGPFSITIDGLPDDFEADLAIVAQCTTYHPGDYGNGIVPARIEGGVLHFRFPEDASNLGSQGSFFILYAVRNNYTPQPQLPASLFLSLDDVSGTGTSTVTALDASLTDGFASFDAAISKPYVYGANYSQQFDLDKDFDMLPPSLSLPMISRGSRDNRYRTCINVVNFNRHFHSIDIRQYHARMQSYSMEVFGSVPITTNVI